jgi:hypothetical protein
MGKIDLRNAILNANDIEEETVEVKEWGVKILVRGLTGEERSAMMNECIDMKTRTMDMSKLYTSLVIACSFDPESKEKIFTSADAGPLNKKSGKALEVIAKKASLLSGMNDDDIEINVKN